MKETIIIEPSQNLIPINFKEIYRYRELFITLAQRDLKIRYKQTLIGGAWAILQPFMNMVVFSFFFGKIAKIPSDGVPYPIFSYAGLLLWTFFNSSFNATSGSILSSSNLISKVYFPRLIIPFASSLAYIVDYLVASIIMFGLMAYYQIMPSINIFFIPFIVLITWLLASGMGLWASALSIKYRDIRFIIPFGVQLLLFATPVIYPASVAGNYKWIVGLNPMSGLIEAHRAMILGNNAINLGMLGISLLVTLIILISGLYYFRSIERYIVDIL